ncbi:hypothetical protein LCGC14_1921970 [marine sediment metagenome]|uniref:HTH luxR-type domain-containing protein n=1 Tax=marine sediment metagenome TaxID=412755 RepID=A0A0F9I4E3_9ZZZZ
MDHKAFADELKRLDAFATEGYVLALHIRFTSAMLHYQTYSQAWKDYYSDHGFFMRDPVVAWAFSSQGWTRWSNPEIHDPFGIFAQAAEFGLRYGVTFSVGPVRARSVASLARRDREFSDREIAVLEKLVHRLHDMSRPPTSLTRAQLDALQSIADGNRHAAAAAKLEISESALKLRLASAREKLMARTTAEAIQRAKDYNLM